MRITLGNFSDFPDPPSFRKLVLMWIAFALFVILLMMTGCYEGHDVIYRISEGEHYSTPVESFSIDSNPLVFYAVFDKSAQCETEDINKLFGFSDCNSTVHDSSARFGWRWHNERIEIFSYVYCAGERSFTYITDVPADREIRYEIRMTASKYQFVVGNKMVEEDRCNGCEKGIYQSLHPYFGGDEPACQDIRIRIRIK